MASSCCQASSSASVKVSSHPVMKSLVTSLRDKNISSAQFRAILSDAGRILAYESTTDLAVSPRAVETPLAAHTGVQIKEKIALVPILRAGLGISDAFLAFLPEAAVWHIGLYRDSKTKSAVEYYNKLPDHCDIDCAYVIDPMLATGRTSIAAIDILKEWGCRKIKFICLLAAKDGIRNLQEAHPDVSIFAGEVDDVLTPEGYILPGLGDAGDRSFSTYGRTHM